MSRGNNFRQSRVINQMRRGEETARIIRQIRQEQEARMKPATEFDAAKLEITRHRPSTTQGEVTLTYAGEKIARYGDTIRLVDGKWEGEPDSFWTQIAKQIVEPTTYDLGLVREVFRETYAGLDVYANLNRWGGLTVFVNLANDAGGFPLWQGDNILEARAWAAQQEKAA